MSTAFQLPEILEFAKLLAPISAEKPTGIDLRTDTAPGSLYYATRDARTAAKVAERPLDRGEDPDPASPPPDWRPVLQNACKALTEKTKDLELTAYAIEALVRLHGFAGLRDGLRLARELVERFWDQLYPVPDQDGMLTRVAPLTGLNGDEADGTLLAPLARVPITETTGAGRFATHHYHDAVALKKVTDPKAREKRIAQGAVTFETLEQAVKETPPAFYQRLMRDLEQCLNQLAQLDAALSQRCKEGAPPTSAIRNALESCREVIKDVARAKLVEPEKPKPPGDVKPGAADGDSAAAERNGLQTREDAFRRLLDVADFFRRTEPQSLLIPALEQVVRWGKMQPAELFAELIPEEAPRKSLFKQVGMTPAAPPPKDGAKK